ncbi:hypothetical protein AB7M45_008536 [Bradyrhizobium elkanii]
MPDTVDGASVTAPILSRVGFNSLYHSVVAVSPAPRRFFSVFSAAMTALRIAVRVGPLSAVSVKKGRMLMRFFSAASHRMVLTSEFGCAPWVSM